MNAAIIFGIFISRMIYVLAYISYNGFIESQLEKNMLTFGSAVGKKTKNNSGLANIPREGRRELQNFIPPSALRSLKFSDKFAERDVIRNQQFISGSVFFLGIQICRE